MRPYPKAITHAMAVLTLAVASSGCSTAGADTSRPLARAQPPTPPGTPVPTAASSERTRLASFARKIGVDCEWHDGQPSCIGGRPEVGDYSDIDLHPDCATDGVFGFLNTPRSAELRDRISPLDRSTNAVIEAGQPLCIRAVGHAGEHPLAYYVAAMPASQVPGCASHAGCVSATPLRVRWQAQRDRGDCSPEAATVDHCASGWLWGGDVTLLPQRN